MDNDTRFLGSLINSFSKVEGIAALVLGGSRAKGTHHPDSDFDIGLYYYPDTRPDLDLLQNCVKNLDDRKPESLLTTFGEWGPWINGGGWLKIGSFAVDILYRDLSRVQSVFSDCLNGNISITYQPGHPHGFVNSIYLAEVAHGKILYEKAGAITDLKSKINPYPKELKKSTVEKFLWEADFSLKIGQKGIAYRDVSFVSGAFFRAVSCINQVLFALNGQYWMNEKGAVRAIHPLEISPPDFEARINAIFSHLEPSQNRLDQAATDLSVLIEETTQLSQSTRAR